MPKGRYVHNLLIALDQLGNAACEGDPTETISSRLGRNAAENKNWAIQLAKVVDWLFLRYDNQLDHCRKSYELRLTWYKQR